MSSKLRDGAEGWGTGMWWTAGDGTIVTTPVRSGARAYSCSGVFFANPQYLYRNFTAVSEGYWRVCMYVASTEFANLPIRLRKGTTLIAQIGYNGTNLTLYIGATLVATGTLVVARNVYYMIEVRLKIADSGGVAQVMVNGVIDIDYSGDTQPGADTTVDNLYVTSVGQSHTVGATFFDDIGMNDTEGTADNSWVGDGRILYLPTNDAGDQSGFTPSVGLNYQCVDEVPNNGDTDYVDGTTLDSFDLYHLAACGLEADSQILRVWGTAVAKDTVANGGKIAIGLKTGGTEYWGDDITLTTDYTAKEGTVHTVNPKTNLPWTIADLDGLQAGPKARGN